MKALLVAAGIVVSAVVVSSSAFAAAPVAPPASWVDDWNGAYIGVNAGLGGGTFSYPWMLFDNADPFLSGTVNAQAFGAFGGGQIGYNFQIAPHWVVGIEGDLEASNINDEVSADENLYGSSVSGKTTVDWFGTLRGRVGYTGDRWMVYGTAGLAFGSVKSGYSIDIPPLGNFSAADSVTSSAAGWAAGAGIEYKLTHNLSLKTEYLYVDLGKQKLLDTFFNTGDDNTDELSIDQKIAFHTIKVGLNLGF